MYSTVSKLFALSLCLLLTGCWESNRQAETAKTKTVETVGIQAGQPTQLTETTTERIVTDEKMQAGVDVSKALTAGLAAIRGDFMKALEQMRPSSSLDGTTGGLATGAVSMGLLYLREFMLRRKRDCEVDEEYQRANEAHAREVELAKQLPPTNSTTPKS